MPAFEFQVVRSDRKTIAHETRVLPDIGSVWDEVARLADHVDDIGARLHVLDESGEAIIRVGVATARASGRPDRLAA